MDTAPGVNETESLTSSQEHEVLYGEEKPRKRKFVRKKESLKHQKRKIISGVRKMQQFRKYRSFSTKLSEIMLDVMNLFISKEKHSEYEHFVIEKFQSMPLFSNFNGFIDKELADLENINTTKIELFREQQKKQDIEQKKKEIEEKLSQSILKQNFVHYENETLPIPENINDSQSCIEGIKKYQSRVDQLQGDGNLYNSIIGGFLKRVNQLYKGKKLNINLILESHGINYKKSWIYFLISWYDLVSAYSILQRTNLSIYYIQRNFKYIKDVVSKNPQKWK